MDSTASYPKLKRIAIKERHRLLQLRHEGPETKTARFPEENRAVSKTRHSGEMLMGCQKCTSMREKRQSLQVRAR
ncbi:hypothetical protein AT6N2_C0503 [Agrobacterium tumefaciens]|nr:hypothetical protein AT6N2_C0503 [Agrobacterium tumefaciens]